MTPGCMGFERVIKGDVAALQKSSVPFGLAKRYYYIW